MPPNTSEPFETNSYYLVDSKNATYETISSLENHKGLSQLSLFSDLDNANQDANFLSITKSFNHDFFFIKQEKDDQIVWHCYIEQSVLNDFVNNEIRESQFDYILWPQNHNKRPKLLVFDMDSTFIKIEVIDELARAHNVGETVSKVTESAMRGELDFSESLVTRVACLKGLSGDTIHDIASTLPLSDGVDELVQWAHSQDIKIAIVSGGFTPFVQKLKTQMSLFKVKANNLEIKQERLTGQVLGAIVDAQAKADFVNHLKQELNLHTNEIMSIGDGANDLLMMQETGFSLAYRAKPAVDKKAGGRMKVTHLSKLIDVFTVAN